MSAVYWVVKSAVEVMEAGVPVRSAMRASLLPAQRKMRGGLGLDGEGGLAIALAVAKAGEAEDELVDLLLSGSRVGQRDGVGDVVEEGAGDGEIGRLGCGIVAPCSEYRVLVLMTGGGPRESSWRTLGAPGGAISGSTMLNFACAATRGAHPWTCWVSSREPLW